MSSDVSILYRVKSCHFPPTWANDDLTATLKSVILQSLYATDQYDASIRTQGTWLTEEHFHLVW